MKKIILLAFFCTLTAITYCQITATTEDGKKVSLSSDGTWGYIVEEMPVRASVSDFDDCDCRWEYAVNELDEFTGLVKKSIKPTVIGKSDKKKTLYGGVGQSGEYYTLYLMYIGDLGCMSNDRSTAIIKFTDDSTIELTHVGKTDCSSDKMTFGAMVDDHLDELRTKQVTRIRLTGTEHYDDITITKGTFFRDGFNCCIF
jgi:hypothetical protein